MEFVTSAKIKVSGTQCSTEKDVIVNFSNPSNRLVNSWPNASPKILSFGARLLNSRNLQSCASPLRPDGISAG
jgi:hypothetical protein